MAEKVSCELTPPEYFAYKKELLEKQCLVCKNNKGTKGFPFCIRDKSWPKYGICRFLEEIDGHT